MTGMWSVVGFEGGVDDKVMVTHGAAALGSGNRVKNAVTGAVGSYSQWLELVERGVATRLHTEMPVPASFENVPCHLLRLGSVPASIILPVVRPDASTLHWVAHRCWHYILFPSFEACQAFNLKAAEVLRNAAMELRNAAMELRNAAMELRVQAAVLDPHGSLNR